MPELDSMVRVLEERESQRTSEQQRDALSKIIVHPPKAIMTFFHRSPQSGAVCPRLALISITGCALGWRVVRVRG